MMQGTVQKKEKRKANVIDRTAALCTMKERQWGSIWVVNTGHMPEIFVHDTEDMQLIQQEK